LLGNSDIRASVDARNETLGKRIREISLLRVPVLVIVGEKEMNEGSVSVRREGVDQGSMTAEDFVKYIKAAVAEELS
jgi:threonyl-tRNA synthetase